MWDLLTRLVVRNFKRFRDLDIDLGSPVVFVGPNNSGKTSALQALALWEAGVRKWAQKRRGARTAIPEKRPGVTINRKDLVSIPVPDANLLWHNTKVRTFDSHPKPHTNNVRIEILVEGVSDHGLWRCGLEFDYANEESFYCRPLRADEAYIVGGRGSGRVQGRPDGLMRGLAR